MTVVIDKTKAFQFISCEDHGETCCPHCGANGRYIYTWSEYGVVRSAMAGCYKALTGLVKMDDIAAYMLRLSVKLAKNKALNGWDKTVVRMEKYKAENANDEGKYNWANKNIRQAVASSRAYQFKRF